MLVIHVLMHAALLVPLPFLRRLVLKPRIAVEESELLALLRAWHMKGVLEASTP